MNQEQNSEQMQRSPARRGPRDPSNMGRIAKAMARVHAFVLRRNWAPAMGEKAMVVTTTGRKSGNQHRVAVQYVRDENGYYAMNPGGRSDWYKNLLANPDTVLDVQGDSIPAQAQPVSEPSERRRLFEMFRRDHRDAFEHIFEVRPDAPQEQLNQALAAREFMHFVPKV